MLVSVYDTSLWNAPGNPEMKFKRGKHGGNIFSPLSYNIEPRATQVQIPTHVGSAGL